MGCDPPEDGGSERFYVLALEELTIYGHTVDAWTQEKYPEDWPSTLQGYRNGYVFGCWHSQVVPNGEIGSNAQGLRRISYDEFLEAQENFWPHLEDEHPGVPVSAIYVPDGDGGIKLVWDSLRGDVEDSKTP